MGAGRADVFSCLRAAAGCSVGAEQVSRWLGYRAVELSAACVQDQLVKAVMAKFGDAGAALDTTQRDRFAQLVSEGC